LLPLVLNLEFDQVIPQDPTLWKYIIGLALLTAMVPQYLYSTLAPLIGPARSAMAGSFELPTMFIIGFMVFGETIGVVQILSGMLVMTAIVITPAISSNRRVTNFDVAN
jgi:drug/metabolite transporter (DMT)-like permease